jgi:hypothetical protein
MAMKSKGVSKDNIVGAPSMTHPKLLIRFKCEFESENIERRRNWGMFLSL